MLTLSFDAWPGANVRPTRDVITVEPPDPHRPREKRFRWQDKVDG